MARMHIMEAGEQNVYHVIVHAPVPAGNNAANVPWADAIKNAGLVRTEMNEGTGPGQIDPAEFAEIMAGTKVEASFQWQDDPSWTNQQRLNDLNLRATQAIDEIRTRLQQGLKYFGHTVA